MFLSSHSFSFSSSAFPPKTKKNRNSFGTCCGFLTDDWKFGGENNSDLTSSVGFSGGHGTTPNGFLFTLCLVENRCSSLDQYDKGNGFSPWFVALFFGPSSSSSPPGFFARAAAERWSELRKGAWSDASMKSMLEERVQLLSSGPGERTLTRWPALAAEASKAAERVVGEGGGNQTNSSSSSSNLVAAVGSSIRQFLLERARWLDGAFAQAASGAAARGSGYPASYAAVA